jgi:hypothetical protein
MAVSLWRGVGEDWREEQRQEKLLRKRMRELAAKKTEQGQQNGV